MENMFIDAMQVESTREAAKAAAVLVDRVTWFSLEPLSDDRWEIQFKADEGHRQAITAAVKKEDK